MAAALQCDMCEILYKKYAIKPVYHHYKVRQKSENYNKPIFVSIQPGLPFSAYSDGDKGYDMVDLCGPCLRKVVEEYLKAIPTEA